MIRRRLPDLSVLLAAVSLALYTCTGGSDGVPVGAPAPAATPTVAAAT